MKKMRQYLMASLAIGTLATALLVPATSAAADPPTLNLKATDSLPSDVRNIIKSGGSYGIYQTVTSSGRTIEFVGTMDPNATCAFDTQFYSGGGLTCQTSPGYGMVRTTYFTHNSYGGNGGCSWGNCTSTGMIVYADPEVQPGYPGYPSYPVTIAGTYLSAYEFYVMNFDITYPTGYTGDIIPTSLPAPKYVAMGDSFSSGEGNEPFENGTDTSTDKCHRSTKAYPRLLQYDTSFDLGSTAFVACSGATTWNVLNGQNGEPPQVDALSSNTKVVTLTVGGNDIGFSEFAKKCLFGSCAAASAEYQESWNRLTDITRSDYLPVKLDTLFASISSHLWINPDVKVYVVGYPKLMTHSSWEARNQAIGTCGDFDENEAIAAEAIVTKLNETIQAAVTAYDDSRFVYVDPQAAESSFPGHELCRSGTYFNDVETGLSNQAYVFHPNNAGHQAFANLLKNSMN